MVVQAPWQLLQYGVQACQEWSVHLLRLSGMPLPRSRTGSWLPPPQMACFVFRIFILHSQYTTFPPDGLLAKRVPPLPHWPASWSIFHVWVRVTNIVNQYCQIHIFRCICKECADSEKLCSRYKIGSNLSSSIFIYSYCKSLPFFYFLTFEKGRLFYIHPVGRSVGRSTSPLIFFNIYNTGIKALY